MGVHVIATSTLGLLLTLSLVQGKPWFCGDQDCPSYKTTSSKRGYDIREYGETKWVCTSIEASNPYLSTRQLRQMWGKLWPYYRGENSQGNPISLSVPAMNRVHKIGSGRYNMTMMWYLPGDPPTPTLAGVFLTTRPAGKIYVTDFQTRRWPRDQTFVTYYKRLTRSIRSRSSYKPNVFYRVSYNYPFDTKKKQHEVWLDKE